MSFNEAVEQLHTDERMRAAAVIDRLKDVLGCDSDSELAYLMNTTPQNIWNWRSRDSVPYREVVFFALWARVSPDYLLTGQGAVRRRHVSDRSDYELLRDVLQLAMEPGEAALTPDLYRKIVRAYEQADQCVAKLTAKQVMPDHAEARAIAIDSIRSIFKGRR